MKSNTEELVEWLRDAYAMEKSMEKMLQRTMEDDHAPVAVRQIARTHLGETTRHAENVERCLDMLDSDVSSIKTGAATVGEFFKDAMSGLASDKPIKDLLTGYAGEHFEIACYTAIRTAAQNLGESRIVAICDSILDDEHRTAERLQECIPGAVEAYLAEPA